jgi:hypothetical protein
LELKLGVGDGGLAGLRLRSERALVVGDGLELFFRDIDSALRAL